MSIFVGAATLNFVVTRDDHRAVDEALWRENAQHDVVLVYPQVHSLDSMINYANDFWPGGTLDVGGDGGISQNNFLAPTKWGPIWEQGGANGRLGFVGITRDAYGSPLPNCTVRCFRVSTDELVSKVTSDPTTGYYIATTPYNDAHFLVVHSAAGDVAGASVNTILPA